MFIIKRKEAKTYTVVVFCINCYWGGKVEIEKGKLAHPTVAEKECPNCGCVRLR